MLSLKRYSDCKLEIFLAVAYLIFLLVFALKVHPIEDNDVSNPELDFYCASAKLYAQGQFPPDPYRPALYPVLTALLGSLYGDFFQAGQFISLISCFLFVFCSFRLAKGLYGARVAWFSIIAIALNSHVLIASVRCATDMLFNALCLLSLWWCQRLDKEIPKRLLDLVFLGFFCGLACLTRYTGIFLFPALIFFLLFRKEFPLKNLLVFFVSFVITISPQLSLNYYQFGDPFHNENWRNVAMKYMGFILTSDGYVQHSKEQFLKIIIQNPFQILEVAGSNIFRFLVNDLLGIFFAFRTFHTKVEVIFLLLFFYFFRKARFLRRIGVAAFIKLVASRVLTRRRVYIAPIYLISTVLGIGFTFSIHPRLILATLPIFVWGLTGFLVKTIVSEKIKQFFLIGLLLMSLFGQVFSLEGFIQRHSKDDLLASRWICENYPSASVLGTSLFLGNHFPFKYTYLDSFLIIHNPEQYIEKIFKTISEKKPDYFLVNLISSYGNPTPLVLISAPNQVFPFLTYVKSFGKSVIFKIDYTTFNMLTSESKFGKNGSNGSAEVSSQ